MDVRIEPTWKSKLHEEFEKEYFLRLAEFVKEEYRLQDYISSRKPDF
jgi:uracil-DNA glycosylase